MHGTLLLHCRVEQFLQNYNDTVAKFAREIARHTARRVWHAGDRCYKVGPPRPPQQGMVGGARATAGATCRATHNAYTHTPSAAELLRAHRKVISDISPLTSFLLNVARL